MMDDRSICSFYQKIGACRHGDKCSRKHVRPTESKTILLANLYHNPKAQDSKNSDSKAADEFNDFYADVFRRVAREGVVDQIVVCENENFHLSGNVYVHYTSTDAAAKAVILLNQEWFRGKPVYCELSPVTSFYDANCRAHDTNTCTRGDRCNFMHVRKPSNEVRKNLRLSQDKLVALNKLREVIGDPEWGKEWEEATDRVYELGTAKKNETKKEVVEETTQEKKESTKAENAEADGDDKPTTTEAVAKLFAA